MQDLDWDDLRHLLAVARAGSFAAAGRQLSVSETTVMRRLARAEKRLGTALLEKRRGSPELTPAGQALAARAAEAERGFETALADHAAGEAAVAGLVRITAVPVLINRVLTRALPALLSENPALEIELVPEARDLSLERGEADIALRMARPSGELRTLARRVARLEHGVFAARERRMGNLPWLTYGRDMGHLPQNAWIAHQPGPRAAVRANDAETMIACAARGLGKAVLPRIVGRAVPELAEIQGDCNLTREVWRITHPAQRRRPRIDAVCGWIDGIVGAG